MNLRTRAAAGLAAFALFAMAAELHGPASAHAQPAPVPEPELFEQTQVRDLYVQFADADWRQQLDRTGESGNVRADLTVDGLTYPGVGLRYKGLSSSRVQGVKKPFNLTLDAFTPGQRLYGFDTVNLNNSYADPSYLREVLTNDLLRPFLPTPRVAYAKLHLNGSYWGLYVLSEQIERTFLDAWFRGNDGLLVKADSPTFGEMQPRAAAGSQRVGGGEAPQGLPARRVPADSAVRRALAGEPAQGGGFGLQSNLTWRGEALGPYRQNYEVKTASAGDAGYEALRELIRQLDAPPANGGLADADFAAGIPAVLDVDSALWYLAATNAVMNYDCYYFGHNYFLHRAEADSRWYPLLWDTSLSLGVFNLAGGGNAGLARTSPFIQASDPTRPLVRRLLAVPRWRADYLAHFRTVRAATLDAAAVEAKGRALQDLIRPAVVADSNRLYSLETFEENLDQDVSLGPGAIIISNGDIPGILPIVRARAAALDAMAELAAPDHALAEHRRVPEIPAPGQAPRLVVEFTGADDPVAVEAVLRVESGLPQTLAMARDGAGWAAELPGLPARSRVSYYVHVTFADGRTVFHPASNWIQPWRFRVAGPELPTLPPGDLVLNELMADNVATLADEAGDFDDWVELVNRGAAQVSLAGHFLGQSPEDPWAFPLPPGELAPGERLLIWCDKDTSQGPLHAPFKLAKDGDRLLLATRDAIVDDLSFGPLAADHSQARLPDGSGPWADCASPSPRAPNACGEIPSPTATAPPPPTATNAPPDPTATEPASDTYWLYLPLLRRQ